MTRSSRRSGACLALSGWLLLCGGPALGGPVADPLPAAEADSLVWYVEELEHDLALCQVHAGARADSLRLRCEWLAQRLEWAEQDQRRWYHDPRLWFLVGAAATAFVLGGSLQVSF